MSIITSVARLEAIYGEFGAVGEASTATVADHVTPQYRRYLEAAPFAALATVGPEGLDCSPRGDKAGFIRVHDDHTLMLPDPSKSTSSAPAHSSAPASGATTPASTLRPCRPPAPSSRK